MADRFVGDRISYERGGLERWDLLEDPFEQFRLWLADAEQTGLIEPSAMSISSASASGRPSSRMVLLRSIDHGFVFFTNYLSRKGQELDANPYGAALFWWPVLERQVRVEGIVERVSAEESDGYFSSRPRESQLASIVSPQSREIPSREDLESLIADLASKNPDPVARPDSWGGYRLIPDRFEFWQGRPARLHDRFLYEADADMWKVMRLAP